MALTGVWGWVSVRVRKGWRSGHRPPGHPTTIAQHPTQAMPASKPPIDAGSGVGDSTDPPLLAANSDQVPEQLGLWLLQCRAPECCRRGPGGPAQPQSPSGRPVWRAASPVPAVRNSSGGPPASASRRRRRSGSTRAPSAVVQARQRRRPRPPLAPARAPRQRWRPSCSTWCGSGWSAGRVLLQRRFAPVLPARPGLCMRPLGVCHQ